MTDQALVRPAAGSATTVRLDGRGLVLGDSRRRLALYSGSMHYWQHDRALWRPMLHEIRELGFEIVDTYIPWSVHEEERGTFSFDGNRDIDAFLQMCDDEGLFVIARPGPHINAELTEFGYPARLVRNERLQARTATGAPAIHVIPPKAFPILSYTSEEFFREVKDWYAAICPIVVRNQYPDGPIVMVQADNEHSYFFKLTPYDVDYSDGAVAHFRAVLGEKYSTIERLNHAYRTDFASFDDVEPPRKFAATTREELPRYLDWAYAKERYLTDGVSRIASMLRVCGVTKVPISHNSPGWSGVPYNQVALEQSVDVHGVDFYVHKNEYAYLKQGCQYLAGTARLPFIPEFGAGTWPWWEPIDDTDAEVNALTALMHGIKAINYYMVVERDRWLGSPIGRRGDVREPTAQLYRRLLAFLRESEWTSVDRRNDVLLLSVREYERFAFSSRAASPPFFPEALGPLADLLRHEVFAEQTLGFEQWIPRAMRTWASDCSSRLAADHYGFVLGDSESPLDWLLRFKALIVPGFEFMTQETQEKLLAYAWNGGNLIIGPRVPVTDETGAPCAMLSASTERIQVVERSDELSRALSKCGVTPLCDLDNPELELAVHSNDTRAYLFVANPTRTAQSGRLRWTGVKELRDVWSARDPLREEDGAFQLSLQPQQIQVWAC